MNKGKKVSFFS